MSLKIKAGIIGAVAAVLVAFGAFGLGGLDTTEARFQNTGSQACNPTAAQGTGDPCVYRVAEHGIDPTVGTVAMEGCQNASGAARIVAASTTVLGTGESILICVNTSMENRQYSKLTFDSNAIGRFDRAACGVGATNDDGDPRVAEWPDDACLAVSGNNTSQLVIDETINGGTNSLRTVIVRYTCTTPPGSTRIVITHSEGGPGTTATGAPGTTFNFEFNVECRGTVTTLTPVVRPSTVEIIPARSNTSHSLISVVLTATGGTLAAHSEVQWTTDRCRIEAFGSDGAGGVSFATIRSLALQLNPASPQTYWDFEFSAGSIVNALQWGTVPDTTPQIDAASSFDFPGAGITGNAVVASAILACNPVAAPGLTPGPANVTICATAPSPDLCTTVQITVIGPPAAVTATASPSTVRCGERVTITGTVRDSIGQNVSDHTRVELVTNLGGVIAGTGAVAGWSGPVVPISSTVAETFGGTYTAFLLTSETHSGPYEVVVTTGGTVSTDPAWQGPLRSAVSNVLGGQFSTPPVNAFVNVTCTVPAPAAPTAPVTAPSTGGGIVPPSTGDAGLAETAGMNFMLVGLAAAVALALAGGLGFKLIRR